MSARIPSRKAAASLPASCAVDLAVRAVRTGAVGGGVVRVPAVCGRAAAGKTSAGLWTGAVGAWCCGRDRAGVAAAPGALAAGDLGALVV